MPQPGPVIPITPLTEPNFSTPSDTPLISNRKFRNKPSLGRRGNDVHSVSRASDRCRANLSLRHRGAGRYPHVPTHNGIGTQVAGREIGYVHAATDTAAVAVTLPEQLRDHPVNVHPQRLLMQLAGSRASIRCLADRFHPLCTFPECGAQRFKWLWVKRDSAFMVGPSTVIKGISFKAFVTMNSAC